MRFSNYILAALALLTVPTVEGAVRFGEPREFPDVGLSLPLPEDAVAEPFDLPKAAAFAVTGDITLPDALRYAVRKTKGYPTTFTAFTAGGALIGNPTTLTPEPGMNSRQVVIDPTAKTIGFAANGLILMVR